jgi:hypothetical protein
MLGPGNDRRRQPAGEGGRVMDFGIGIASGVDGWKAAQRAEAPGFTHARPLASGSPRRATGHSRERV